MCFYGRFAITRECFEQVETIAFWCTHNSATSGELWSLVLFAGVGLKTQSPTGSNFSTEQQAFPIFNAARQKTKILQMGNFLEICCQGDDELQATIIENLSHGMEKARQAMHDVIDVVGSLLATSPFPPPPVRE
ncbi:UNVERIFIED_CONTAM: hypothetical protein HHA_450240 [Hammondia hammondi]|eukprot:XP_008889229.1 hypothetical protein HHA_450240 [Hammondia hammondi]